MAILPAARAARCRQLIVGVAIMVSTPSASGAADTAQAQCIQDFQAMGVPIPGVTGPGAIETLCRCQNDRLREGGVNPDDLRQRISDELTKLMSDIKDVSPEARTKLITSSPYMRDMQLRGAATAMCITKMATPVAPPPAANKR